jgi:hypothetical protein
VNHQVVYPAAGVAIPVGTKLTVARETPVTQEIPLDDQGYFKPTVIMKMLDKLTQISQELDERVSRTIRYAVDESPDSIETENFLALIEVARDQALEYRNSAESYRDQCQSFINDAEGSANAAAGSATEALEAKNYAEEALTNITNLLVDLNTLVDSANSAAATASGAAVSASDSADIAIAAASDSALNAASATDSATAASLSEASAANAAASAAAAVASALWKDVEFLTFADSPVTITESHRGKILSIDASGGEVVLNLPEVSSLDLSMAWAMGVKKTDVSANAIKINRSGTDLIDGGTSKSITSQDSGATLIPDTDPTPDKWTSCDFGAGGGGIGAPQGTRQSGVSISTSTQIIPAFGKPIQTIFIKGNGGPVTVTSLVPVAVANMIVGQQVTLAGTDDAAKVTFAPGLSLEINGEAELGKDDLLTLEFLGSDGTNISWGEKGRSF